MRDIKYDTVLRKCRENDAAEMYVANTIWPTDEGPVSGKAVTAALATKQPLITPEHKLPAELVEGGGGSAEWGGITGDIADQADLQAALGGKLGTDAVGVTVAELVDGKVPAEELPDMDYIPASEKGAANGVASLGANSIVPSAQLPTIPPAPIVASGAPTTSTVGVQGQLYLDTATSKTYHCTAAASGSYTWVDDVNAKGGTFSTNAMLNLTGNNGGIKIETGRFIFGNSATATNYNCFAVGYYASVTGGVTADTAIALGTGTNVTKAGTTILGRWNNLTQGPLIVIGNGSSNSNRSDIAMVNSSGVKVFGYISQGITTIPPVTSAYTLTEGQSKHVPSSAPTYTLPDVPQLIIADGKYFTRNTTTDGTGYYGWLNGTTNRYTASATPAVGDNTYTNTALTSGAKAITALDERTHTIVLSVLFRGYYRSTADDSGSAYAWKAKDNSLLYTDTATPTAGTTLAYSDTALTTSVGAIALYDSEKSGIAMVGSLSFEDSGENVIVPLDGPSPSVGAEICYLCEWSALQGQWTIMPIGMGGAQ